MAETRNAFNFQRDFSQAAATSMYLEKGTHLPVPHAQHTRLLEQAHQEAYARGLQDGRQQQRDDEANRIAEALAQIRAIRQDVPYLFISGYARDIISGRMVLDDDAVFISKPVNPALLLETMRQVLERQR